LLSSVNPKTDAKNAMGSRSMPYYGWTMLEPRWPFAHEAEMLVEQQCADEVIDRSTDFRAMAP
jgi:hypothetical protein